MLISESWEATNGRQSFKISVKLPIPRKLTPPDTESYAANHRDARVPFGCIGVMAASAGQQVVQSLNHTQRLTNLLARLSAFLDHTEQNLQAMSHIMPQDTRRPVVESLIMIHGMRVIMKYVGLAHHRQIAKTV